MDPEMEAFIANLDDDEPFSPNQQMNEMWKELEDYFDKEFFDIDKFLDELLPDVQPISTPVVNDIQVIASPTQLSTKDFIKSFGIGESFYKDVIADPKLNFKDKNFVPAEILLRSIRSRITECRYHHSLDTLESTKLPMSMLTGINDFSGTESNQYHSLKSVASIDPFQTVENENISWYFLLENQQIYPGITVDSVVANIMSNHAAAQMLPRQDEIVRTVNLLFTILNNFINRLTIAFAEYKFYDASQLTNMIREIQEEIVSNSNIKVATLLEILTKWIGLVTQKFVQINEQRRQVEEKVSQKIIDRAVETYKSQLESIDQNEDISIVRKKKTEHFCQGIRRIYLNCGVQFNAKTLRTLEERLEEINSTLVKSGHSHYKSNGSSDFNVEIKLLVSDYVSNINQKGLQCAGISTLHQFDDVNKNCLVDIKRSFEKQMKGVPSDKLIDLKKEFQSILDSESKNKRSEFNRKTNKFSTSTRITSLSSTTRSHSVGIHFGFETLSVSYFNEASNNFRTIYGPSANVVAFVPQRVFIGSIPETGRLLNMENLLTEPNVGDTYDTEYYGKLRVEEIIALILMQIDQIVKQNLRTTSKIKYSLAIPSCFNTVMQSTFRIALNIADIEGNLVREQCALTTYFVRENHKIITKNKDEYIITLIENPYKSCDSVRYEIVHGNKITSKITAKQISGNDESNNLLNKIGLRKKSGIQLELENIKFLQYRSIRFIVSCPNIMIKENTAQIKNQFYNSKVHVSKSDSIQVANGAALLASIANADKKLEIPFDLRHLTAIKDINGSHRLKHTGSNFSAGMIPEISAKLRSLIDTQSEEFEKTKADTKQFLMGKMKYLEDSNHPEHREEIEKDLKCVEEEQFNEFVIKKIADLWKDKIC